MAGIRERLAYFLYADTYLITCTSKEKWVVAGTSASVFLWTAQKLRKFPRVRISYMSGCGIHVTGYAEAHAVKLVSVKAASPCIYFT